MIITLIDWVTQWKKETIREYIKCFTKVEIAMEDTNDNLKCWIFEKGLRSDCTFFKKLRLKEACSLSYLLSTT